MHTDASADTGISTNIMYWKYFSKKENAITVHASVMFLGNYNILQYTHSFGNCPEFLDNFVV